MKHIKLATSIALAFVSGALADMNPVYGKDKYTSSVKQYIADHLLGFETHGTTVKFKTDGDVHIVSLPPNSTPKVERDFTLKKDDMILTNYAAPSLTTLRLWVSSIQSDSVNLKYILSEPNGDSIKIDEGAVVLHKAKQGAVVILDDRDIAE